MDGREGRSTEQGFTLVELLITLVVAGILAAVAIVGTAGVLKTGSGSACQVSRDAATRASAAYYANRTPSVYPSSVQDLATATPAVYSAPAGATYEAGNMNVGSWTLSITAGGGATLPTFTCT
jgi:prepilin-type N-terminal cleavage/methylation domain-containing protein